jgi:hypothetical protein
MRNSPNLLFLVYCENMIGVLGVGGRVLLFGLLPRDFRPEVTDNLHVTLSAHEGKIHVSSSTTTAQCSVFCHIAISELEVM